MNLQKVNSFIKSQKIIIKNKALASARATEREKRVERERETLNWNAPFMKYTDTPWRWWSAAAAIVVATTIAVAADIAIAVDWSFMLVFDKFYSQLSYPQYRSTYNYKCTLSPFVAYLISLFKSFTTHQHRRTNQLFCSLILRTSKRQIERVFIISFFFSHTNTLSTSSSCFGFVLRWVCATTNHGPVAMVRAGQWRNQTQTE